MRSVGRLLSILALVLLTAVPAVPAQRIHTVADGQTLGAIARRYGITIEELREANQLPTGVRLKIGQRLLVPSPGEVARAKRGAAKGITSDTQVAATDRAEADSPGAADAPAPVLASTGDSASPKTLTAAPEPSSSASDAAPVAPPDDTSSAAPAPEPAPEIAKRPTPKADRTAVPAESVSSATHKAKVGARRTHAVGDGQTLGKIAKRYHIKIESLCGANGIRRNERLKLGQELTIPNGDDDPIIEEGPPPGSDERDSSDRHSDHGDSNAMQELSVPGAGPVYYYEPTGTGRLSMRPIVVYLHGRGGDAQADCRRWARVARRFGWLLCPSGPTPHNAGRSWNNNWVSGQHAVMGAVQALRNQYGRRVQLYGNTLVGFSEGAYVAMNVGVRQPRTFNRWMILGADVSYWGGSGLEALKDAKSKVRRVVLITGGMDMVVDDTRTVAGWLEKEGVPLRIQTPGTLAHEVALERMTGMYESGLRWLDRGVDGPGATQARRR